jgi:hypothetical protein
MRGRMLVKHYSDATKTEDGAAFPKAAYAFTPSDEPSTWKLRLWETPDKKETPRQVGMAIAAMGKGFRGNKAQIPDADRAGVMAKIRSAYKKANGKDMPAEMMHALLDGEDVQGYLFDYEQLSGVELFATGEHNGDKYTEKDLDDMVEAFNALDFQPALKAGHTDAPGTPALGYVSALRRVGEKLVADITDVPSEIYKQIRDKKFNRLSAEIYWNLERAGKTYRRALKAVALLGAGVPGVAGLKPLSAAFAEIEAEVKFYDKPGDDMDKTEEARIRKEAEEAAAKKYDELRAKDREEFMQLHATTEERIRMQEEQRAREQRERERAEDVKRHEAQEARLKAMELERKQERIAAVVGRCTVRAFRPFLQRLAEITIVAPDADTKKYEVDVAGDGKMKEFTGLQLVEQLGDAINAKAARLFREHAKLDADYTAPAGDSINLGDAQIVGDEVDRLTKAYMADKKVTDYMVAMNAVLALPENAEIKEAYAKPRTRAA